MQWLIDIIVERVIAEIGIPPVYIYRGDPPASDFALVNFTTDAAWHELDLSGIVPVNAKAVDVSIIMLNTLVGKNATFRRHGQVNAINLAGIDISVANLNTIGDLTIPVDADRKIDYKIEAGGWLFLFFVVKGWWL